MALASVGLGTMLLPCVFGRPPIGQDEAQQHRGLMFVFIVGGAIAVLAGAVALFLIDRSNPSDRE